jgi:acyl homoserine lactone synthase
MPLFPYAMALALSFGATRVIGVVSRSVARLYRRFGLDLHDIGTGTSPDLTGIVACAIDLDSTTFQKIQCDPNALLNSISFFGHPCLPEHGRPVRLHAPGPGPLSAEAGDDAPFNAYDNGAVRTQSTL